MSFVKELVVLAIVSLISVLVITSFTSGRSGRTDGDKKDQSKDASASTHNEKELEKDALRLYDSIKQANDVKSLECIEFVKKIIVNYTMDGISFSFNGGKDCVVLLHIIRIALALLSREKASESRSSSTNNKDENTFSCTKMPVVWMKRDNEFEELISFLYYSVNKYKFPLFETCSDYKSGLQSFLDDFRPNCKGILMGQRRSDPYCNDLKLEAHCSAGWPDMIRINPILDWNFSDVWKFIKSYDIEYCQLYDMGYTSLGSILSTIPNPFLFNLEKEMFEPAHKLTFENAERFGRVTTAKTKIDSNKMAILLHSDDTTVFTKKIKDRVKRAVEVAFLEEKRIELDLSMNYEIEFKIFNDKKEFSNAVNESKRSVQYTFHTSV